jgi:hypothetical protein
MVSLFLWGLIAELPAQVGWPETLRRLGMTGILSYVIIVLILLGYASFARPIKSRRR